MAPMVHWPEVMMTYDLTDKTLFTADAFGTFGALNGHIFADEVDFMHDWLDEARRYYTNIVGKYGPQVQAVLKKASELEINYVCPLHGFVWRKHFGDFLEKYNLWSTYTPEVEGVCWPMPASTAIPKTWPTSSQPSLLTAGSRWRCSTHPSFPQAIS